MTTFALVAHPSIWQTASSRRLLISLTWWDLGQKCLDSAWHTFPCFHIYKDVLLVCFLFELQFGCWLLPSCFIHKQFAPTTVCQFHRLCSSSAIIFLSAHRAKNHGLFWFGWGVQFHNWESHDNRLGHNCHAQCDSQKLMSPFLQRINMVHFASEATECANPDCNEILKYFEQANAKWLKKSGKVKRGFGFGIERSVKLLLKEWRHDPYDSIDVRRVIIQCWKPQTFVGRRTLNF